MLSPSARRSSAPRSAERLSAPIAPARRRRGAAALCRPSRSGETATGTPPRPVGGAPPPAVLPAARRRCSGRRAAGAAPAGPAASSPRTGSSHGAAAAIKGRAPRASPSLPAGPQRVSGVGLCAAPGRGEGAGEGGCGPARPGPIRSDPGCRVGLRPIGAGCEAEPRGAVRFETLGWGRCGSQRAVRCVLILKQP